MNCPYNSVVADTTLKCYDNIKSLFIFLNKYVRKNCEVYILMSYGSKNMSIKIPVKSGWFVGVGIVFGISFSFIGRKFIL